MWNGLGKNRFMDVSEVAIAAGGSPAPQPGGAGAITLWSDPAACPDAQVPRTSAPVVAQASTVDADTIPLGEVIEAVAAFTAEVENTNRTPALYSAHQFAGDLPEDIDPELVGVRYDDSGSDVEEATCDLHDAANPPYAGVRRRRARNGLTLNRKVPHCA